MSKTKKSNAIGTMPRYYMTVTPFRKLLDNMLYLSTIEGYIDGDDGTIILLTMSLLETLF